MSFQGVVFKSFLSSVLALLAALPAAAQPAGAPANLGEAYAAAWARLPEARSLELRRDAAAARRQIANAWTAEAPALELSGKTDQLNRNQGSREYVAGISLPLWLPGERDRFGALADAEAQAIDSRLLAAQLRIAAAIRESWWSWQRARGLSAVAGERLGNARRIAVDVARRVKAGDLARADQHQAEGAVAAAEAALAEAEGAVAVAAEQLRGLIGVAPAIQAAERAERLPVLPVDFNSLDRTHPAVAELLDRAEVARRSAELAAAQKRANPELVLATTRDRGTFADPYSQTITAGVRIPLSSEVRHRAKVSAARAEAAELDAQLLIERERVLAGLSAARIRILTAQKQLDAAATRARLARETRGFFEKSFRLGESDLPTRLRIELEAVEAERQTALTRTDLAAAISELRQALGLLPEQ